MPSCDCSARGTAPTTRGRSSTQRRRIAAAVGLIVGLTAVTGTAVAQLASRDANVPDEVGCYETLDLQANTVGLKNAAVASGEAVTGCRAVWPEAFDRSAPANLVRCVTPAGGRAVFPAEPQATAQDKPLIARCSTAPPGPP